MPIQPALGSEHRSGNAAREVAYVRQRGLTYLREGPSKWRSEKDTGEIVSAGRLLQGNIAENTGKKGRTRSCSLM